MIKKLKIFAIAMLAAGATVSVSNAQKTTNIVQPVAVTLSVYYPQALTPPAADTSKSEIKTGSINSKDLIKTILAPAMDATFLANASLGYLTYSNEVTTIITNVTITVTNTPAFSVTNATTNATFPTTTSNLVLSTTPVGVGVITNDIGNPGTNVLLDFGNGTITNLILGNTNGATVSVVIFSGITNTFSNITATSTNTTVILATNQITGTNALVGTDLAPTLTSVTITVTTNATSTNWTTNYTGITNGVETVQILSGTIGPDGVSTSSSVGVTSTNAVIPTNLLTTISLDTAVVGPVTNAYAPLTNLETLVGVSTNSYDTTAIVITTNTGTNASGLLPGTFTIGNNDVVFTSNEVILGGTVIYSNAPPTNFSVSIGGVVVDTNGVVPGGSLTSTNSAGITNDVADLPGAISLTTTITTIYVTNGTGVSTGTNATGSAATATTNYPVYITNIITTSELVTVTNGTSVLITNFTTNNYAAATNSYLTTNITTNVGEAGQFVVVQGTGPTLTNIPIPTNIMQVTTITTGSADVTADTILATAPADGVTTNVETDYALKKLIITGNTNGTLYFDLDGLVHSTLVNHTVTTHAGHPVLVVPVTNATWTVVGYGITNSSTSNVVVGGTITIGAPANQVIP